MCTSGLSEADAATIRGLHARLHTLDMPLAFRRRHACDIYTHIDQQSGATPLSAAAFDLAWDRAVHLSAHATSSGIHADIVLGRASAMAAATSPCLLPYLPLSLWASLAQMPAGM